MRALIGVPLMALVGPQAAWWIFYRMLVAVVAPTGDGADLLKAVYVLGAVGCLVAGSVLGGGWLVDTGIPAFTARRALLRREREEAQRRLDEEIGIPRIPVRK